MNEQQPTRDWTTLFTAVSAAVASAVKALVLLGVVDWDATQLAGITLVVDNTLAVISAMLIITFVRARVTPVAQPVLAPGTVVNEHTDAFPTSTVEAVADQPPAKPVQPAPANV